MRNATVANLAVISRIFDFGDTFITNLVTSYHRQVRLAVRVAATIVVLLCRLFAKMSCCLLDRVTGLLVGRAGCEGNLGDNIDGGAPDCRDLLPAGDGDKVAVP